MKWNFWHSTALILLIGLMVAVGFLMPAYSPLWTWILIELILLLSILVIGHGLTGVWKGVLVDEENHVSLSRLQMVCWTVTVLSAYLAAAFVNLRMGICESFSVAVPEQLWLLMGISTTSLVGSPLFKSVKKDKPFTAQKFLGTNTFSLLKARGINEIGIMNVGLLVVNKEIKSARWTDLFRGEEVSNAAQVDLSKIQMFYFTLIALIIYFVLVGKIFVNTGECIKELPPLTASLLVLLGISHAGYLTSKAVPRPV